MGLPNRGMIDCEPQREYTTSPTSLSAKRKILRLFQKEFGSTQGINLSMISRCSIERSYTKFSSSQHVKFSEKNHSIWLLSRTSAISEDTVLMTKSGMYQLKA